jgi:hypothetical protein
MSRYQSDQILANPAIHPIIGDEIKSVTGAVGGPKVITTKQGQTIHANAVSSFMGGTPRTDWLPDYVLKNDNGMVRTDRNGQALMKDPNDPKKEIPVPGLFVAGDIREGSMGRVLSALADGQRMLRAAGSHVDELRRQGKLPAWKSPEVLQRMMQQQEPTGPSQPANLQGLRPTEETGKPATPTTSGATATEGYSPATSTTGSAPTADELAKAGVPDHLIPKGKGIMLMPSTAPEGVKSAAVRTPDGKIHVDWWHPGAYMKITEAYPKELLDSWVKVHGDEKTYEDGFVLNNGQFVDRKEALRLALENKQMSEGQVDPATREHGLESVGFSLATDPAALLRRAQGVNKEELERVPERLPEVLRRRLVETPVPSGRQFMPAPHEVAPATEAESAKYLNRLQAPKVGAQRNLADGTPVGVRIDIPAFNRFGKYVQTVHSQRPDGSIGAPIGYTNQVKLNGPIDFYTKEAEAEKIKAGDISKAVIATVRGKLDNSEGLPDGFQKWAPVGFNPKTHSYFYDKSNGNPVIGGDQAVSMGNTVFIKNPVYGRHENFRYNSGGVVGQPLAGIMPSYFVNKQPMRGIRKWKS